MKHLFLAGFVGLLGSSVFMACSDSSTPSDAGTTSDASTGVDSSTNPDTSTPPPPDSGPGVDAGPGDASTADAADGGGFSVVQIVSGSGHSCVRFATGKVKCWGDNALGQLGLGDTRIRGDEAGEMGANLPSVDLGLGRTALQITAGRAFTCARLDDGTVKCWGHNSTGQLGQGDTQNRGDQAGQMGASLPAIDLGAGRTALQISAGAAHACARLDNNSVKCWGNNPTGELGIGDVVRHGDEAGEMGANLPAVDLGAGRTALELYAGNQMTCARLDNATVKCWGNNAQGQLGLGDTQHRGDQPGEVAAQAAVDLGAGRTVLGVATNFTHACARLDNGTVKCWGVNAGGELGQGDIQNRGALAAQMGASLLAIDLGPGRTVLAVTAGSEFNCARLDDSSVKCWGAAAQGQLGLGNAQSRGNAAGQMGASLPAVDLGVGRTVIEVAAGDFHTCARLDNGTVKCWGYNLTGQLGLGDKLNRGNAPGQMGAALPVVVLE